MQGGRHHLKTGQFRKKIRKMEKISFYKNFKFSVLFFTKILKNTLK